MPDAGPRVYWLMQTTADVPPDDEWMAPAERERSASLRSPKRRREWRLGRWTIKNAVAQRMAAEGSAVHHLADLVVHSHPNGAPCCSIHGGAVRWRLSVSHSHDRALSVVAPEGTAIGCDLERVEPRCEEFTREWFTRPEQDAVARASGHERDELTTLVWSAKESALKAIGTGLTVSTDVVTVSVDRQIRDGQWTALRVTRNDTFETMRGWWRTDGADLITVITAPSSPQPAPSSPFILKD